MTYISHKSPYKNSTGKVSQSGCLDFLIMLIGNTKHGAFYPFNTSESWKMHRCRVNDWSHITGDQD